MDKRNFRILVADDDEIAREVVSSLLLREGYAVMSAHDGREAIRRLRVEEIHLVITDLRMPGADGIEVLRYAVRTNPDVAVIILTAHGTLDTALSAIKEGAYYYLTKPFKIQEISLVTDRAYQVVTLIRDNRELRKQLRELYRDEELLRKVAEGRNPGITVQWIERLEQMKSAGLLDSAETEILRERLIHGYGKGAQPNV